MTSFQVIGAGLGRTGTMSMMLALEELGFDPCHHMFRLFENAERNHHLTALSRDLNDDEALEGLFGGYKSVVDHPGCVFYEKFMQLNVNAKVILTIRDSPEAWEKSAQDTIFELNKPMNWFKRQFIRYNMPSHIKDTEKICIEVHGSNPYDIKADLCQLYRDWYSKVVETVPAEKLLIFNVKQGWKPLCDFLGVPIPDKDFPKSNSTGEFQQWRRSMVNEDIKRIVKVMLVTGGIGIAFAAALYSSDDITSKWMGL